MTQFLKNFLWSVIFLGIPAWAVVCLLGTWLSWVNSPVPHCPTMVAMSTTCIPFGCTKTYINKQGEDTGECG